MTTLGCTSEAAARASDRNISIARGCRCGQIRAQDFDRARPVQHVVVGEKHPGHTAAAEQRIDPIQRELRADQLVRQFVGSIARQAPAWRKASPPDRRSAGPTRSSSPRRTADNDPNRLPRSPDYIPGNNRCIEPLGFPDNYVAIAPVTVSETPSGRPCWRPPDCPGMAPGSPSSRPRRSSICSLKSVGNSSSS